MPLVQPTKQEALLTDVPATRLLERIAQRQAMVAVIGLGYVGLPLAVAFAEARFPVIGIDIDASRVDTIRRGESYVLDVSSERLRALVIPSIAEDGRWMTDEKPRLMATTDYAALDRCDVAIICVPTPLSKTRDPDISYVLAAGEGVAAHVHPGMLVVLESTTYPGTTEELLRPMLERGGLQVGRDCFLAFSPERIDPGRTDYTIHNTPKVVGGVTPTCLKVASALYNAVVERVVPVSSPAAAEMVKLLENTFRAVNIALVNEIALMCDKLGLDVWEVIEAAATKPYGFMKFTPGPGVGGHCIPLDPHYLSWKLRKLNYNARFIQLAEEINAEMPYYWVGKVQDALNQAGKPVKGSRVLVLGVAYKKDVNDVRESPALDIIELLRAKGADVRYHDPYVPVIFHNGYSMSSEPDLDQALETADCVIVVTDHSWYDWENVARRARLIVDTRHVIPRRPAMA
ncbi:MAG: nucleotide sugar dehydrogenase [Anaerolineae bacterium]|nr:nucleotide sugar dehydrogenase [Anaerolineae bacterium]MDW8100890.1 nucleotide sugar dehydrogenase [Anaerolineae bacterium]